ncbi:PilZ domain-containing protein [bacterium]|nr:PilZ domain-containing protein [bacterium]
MEKRKHERIPASLRVIFDTCETDHKGTITNISETGMYIEPDMMWFPFETRLQICIKSADKIINLPVRVCRMTKSKTLFKGIGVELVEPSQDYISLVKQLKNDIHHD